MIAPHAPDFAGRDRQLGFPFDLLDHPHQPRDIDVLASALELFGSSRAFDLLHFLREKLIVAGEHRLAAIDRLVADHDRIDVPVLPRELKGAAQLDFIAPGGVGRRSRRAGARPREFLFQCRPVEPDTERDFQPELVGDPGHDLATGGRRIGSDRAGDGSDRLEVGPDIGRVRTVSGFWISRARIGGIGDAGELAVEIRGGGALLQQRPKPCMDADRERNNGDDNAHGLNNRWG